MTENRDDDRLPKRTPDELIPATSTITPNTCTIVADFLGIRLGPCGRDVTHTSKGHCERGHTRTRRICAGHAQAFTALPDQVACEQCAQAGEDTPMTLTISALTTRRTT